MNKKMSGIYYAIASSLIFSIMNMLVKRTSATIPSNEIVFFRSIIGLILSYSIMKYRGIPFSTKNRKFLILRGALGGTYMILYFLALSKLALLDTMILVNITPLFVFMFSSIFLGDRLEKGILASIPIILIGVFITLSPWSYNAFEIAALYGIGAAIFSGAAATSIRYLGKEGHPSLEIIFYFMLMSTIISIPLMWNTFTMPTGNEIISLVAIGVISLTAQVYLTKALTHENAIVVEMVRYIGIVFNAIWGILIFKEMPTITTVIGGCFIICGCVLISQLKRLRLEKSTA